VFRLAEWRVERGIGETRAIRVVDGRIIEARIEPEDGLRAGAVIAARLVRRIPARNQAIAIWDGGEALVTPLPAGITEGAACRIEITRPPLPEPGKPKRARARPAAPDAVPGPGPTLAELLNAPATLPTRADDFEALGWSELLEEAASGRVRFAGGELTISLTPAMTLIDVDGEAAPAELAIIGARAAAEAIVRLDLAGSIGIDLPTTPDRSARLAAAAAIDAAIPQPFERTAVNGFGFIQIVRRRSRLSLPELAASDPVGWHARAALRIAEHTPGAGQRTLTAHPDLVARLAAHPDWLAALERRIGAAVILQGDARRAISAAHVQARHP
jgi:hypothetical protein